MCLDSYSVSLWLAPSQISDCVAPTPTNSHPCHPTSYPGSKSLAHRDPPKHYVRCVWSGLAHWHATLPAFTRWHRLSCGNFGDSFTRSRFPNTCLSHDVNVRATKWPKRNSQKCGGELGQPVSRTAASMEPHRTLFIATSSFALSGNSVVTRPIQDAGTALNDGGWISGTLLES